VFCGCFVMFSGVLRVVFCECFAVFPQHTPQNTRKPSKNTLETEKKHKKLTIHSCIAGYFPRAENRDRIFCKNTLHKTAAKHRKTPQNTRKTVTKRVLRNYVANRKTLLQNAQHAKCAQKLFTKRSTIQPQYVIAYIRFFSKIR